jgi:hypothetical protein
MYDPEKEVQHMTDLAALKKKVHELAEKIWDVEPIKAWFKKLYEEGIPSKTLLRGEVIANKAEVLDRVQRKAEECEFLCHS